MGGLVLILGQEGHGSDEVSCRWIIGGLVFAIVAMAGFIVKQFADRIQDLKEARDLSDTLLDVVEKDRRSR